jgi:prepilin peptidase CpaA
MVFELAIVCLFPWAMAFAAAMDMFTMTIPNRVSLLMTAGFLALAPFMGLGWDGFLNHLGAGAAMLAVGVVMFALGWLGGGDAKLFAAASLWIGFDHLLEFTFLITVAGGALTLALLYFRQTLPHPWIIRQPWAMHLHHPATGVPYGIAIAAAALLVYPDMPWAIHFRA